jgi:hypothetical protein
MKKRWGVTLVVGLWCWVAVAFVWPKVFFVVGLMAVLTLLSVAIWTALDLP